MAEGMTDQERREIRERAERAIGMARIQPSVLFRLLDEIERLRADATKRERELLEKLEQLQETDAARYRFLRDNPLGLRAVDGAASFPPPLPQHMDIWVDAAIEQSHPAASAATTTQLTTGGASDE